MPTPYVINSLDVEPSNLPAEEETSAGWIKRLIYPQAIETKGIFFGQAEVRPGHAAHRWHSHDRDEAPGYEVTYPDTFEEIYFIISGQGVVQWKDDQGKVLEKKVGPGSVMFFPARMGPHQLLNDGHETIRMVFCGTPSPTVTAK